MLPRRASLGFDKFIFIKNTSETALDGNPPAHVVAASLSCASAGCWGRTRGGSPAPGVRACPAGASGSAVCVCKAALVSSHVSLTRPDEEGLSEGRCGVAAKSLSPRGTERGFAVGFSRPVPCLRVKHPKLQGPGTNFLPLVEQQSVHSNSRGLT